MLHKEREQQNIITELTTLRVSTAQYTQSAWNDATSSVPLSQITPILAPSSTPITIHTTLTPPVPITHLTTTPIVELAILPFPSALPFEEKSFLSTSLSNLRTTLLKITPSDGDEDLPVAKEQQQQQQQQEQNPTLPSRAKMEKQGPPRWLSLGWVERPGTVMHADSPSGEAELAILVIGWQSVQEHEAVMGTDEFENAIAPIRGKMLPGIKVLEMRYVRFLGEEEKGGEGGGGEK
ncbi:hypothetical protein ACJ72_06021 [Emergomyces africanus]|uniref:Uncharacterized protein n=1 Tax=Emergomyces africanus TaxID=1955775 RepID=A0A1B7NS90_9EURO|nr:hypothetical protein ACJ72_06021 [Emergomyces africanus]